MIFLKRVISSYFPTPPPPPPLVRITSPKTVREIFVLRGRGREGEGRRKIRRKLDIVVREGGREGGMDGGREGGMDGGRQGGGIC